MGINTADRKPQVVKDPETHKTRVRMVPVDKDVIKTRENKRFKEMRKEEKTLTPAELKKRNDVAKAIKKDDPDMPMDKKMAIATSVAKKTAEDVNEVSSNTLGNYMRKSAAAAAKPGASARTQDKRIGGQKMADNKIRKKMGYSSPAKVPAGANEAHDSEGIKAMKKAGNAKADAERKERQEGKARDRLLKIMNKAGGRTMADRQKDAAAATARRKEAEKDLQSFRQKMGK